MEMHANEIVRFLEEFNAVDEPSTEDEKLFDVGGSGENGCSAAAIARHEVGAEANALALQFLRQCKCPPSVAAALTRDALVDLPESFLLNDDAVDATGDSPPGDIDRDALWKAVTSRVRLTCKQWLTGMPVESLEGLGVNTPEAVSVCAVKNGRRKMEDRHVVIPDLNTLFGIVDQPKTRFYAVFDGHAGTDAANYAAVHLHYNIVHHPDYCSGNVEKAVQEAFTITDNNFVAKSNREGLKSGCTALCCLLQGNKLYVAWVGDSQAVLVRGGLNVDLMVPHKPDRQDEKERIESLGGVVVHFGTWRVNGTLAVSRAIGDVEYKPFVSSSADVTVVDLDGSEDFVLLACDGLWDVLQAQDAIDVVYTYLAHNPGDVNGVAARLVQVAKERGSSDNITVIVTFLRDVMDLSKGGANTSNCVSDLCGDLLAVDARYENNVPQQPKAVNGNPFEVSPNNEALQGDSNVPDFFENSFSSRENETNELLVLEQKDKDDADIYDNVCDSRDFVDFGTRTLRRNQIKPGSIQEFNRDYEENIFATNNPFGDPAGCESNAFKQNLIGVVSEVSHLESLVTNPFQHRPMEDFVGLCVQTETLAVEQQQQQQHEVSSGYSVDAEVPLQLAPSEPSTPLISNLSPNAQPFVMPCLPIAVEHAGPLDDVDSVMRPELPTAPAVETMTPSDERNSCTFADLSDQEEGGVVVQLERNEFQSFIIEQRDDIDDLLVAGKHLETEFPILQSVEMGSIDGSYVADANQGTAGSSLSFVDNSQIEKRCVLPVSVLSNEVSMTSEWVSNVDDRKDELLMMTDKRSDPVIPDRPSPLSTTLVETEDAPTSSADQCEVAENLVDYEVEAKSPVLTESVLEDAAVIRDSVFEERVVCAEHPNSPTETALTPIENVGTQVLLPESHPPTSESAASVADDVEDDESEDGEEWKFYRVDTKKGGEIEKPSPTSPPEKSCVPTTPLSTTEIFTKDFDVSAVKPIAAVVEAPALLDSDRDTKTLSDRPPIALIGTCIAKDIVKPSSPATKEKKSLTTTGSARKVTQSKTAGGGGGGVANSSINRSSINATAKSTTTAPKSTKVDSAPLKRQPVVSAARKATTGTAAAGSTTTAVTTVTSSTTTRPSASKRATIETTAKPASLTSSAAAAKKTTSTLSTRSVAAAPSAVKKKAVSGPSTASARPTVAAVSILQTAKRASAASASVNAATKPDAIAKKALKTSPVASKTTSLMKKETISSNGLPPKAAPKTITISKPPPLLSSNRAASSSTGGASRRPTTAAERNLDVKETKEKVNKQIVGTMKKAAPISRPSQTTISPKTNEKPPKNVPPAKIPSKSASGLSQHRSTTTSTKTAMAITVKTTTNKKPLSKPIAGSHPSKNVPLKGSTKRAENNANEKGILDADSKEVNIGVITPKMDGGELAVLDEKCDAGHTGEINHNENSISINSNDDHEQRASDDDTAAVQLTNAADQLLTF